MKYTETRILHASDLREICVHENWYTHSTNEDYDTMMDLAAGNVTTNVLALIAQDIKGHSNTECTVPQIMTILSGKVICTYTVSAEEEAPMAELDILRAANDEILERWGREWDHRRHLIEAGKSTKISDARLERLDEKIDYLRTKIIELETQEDR